MLSRPYLLALLILFSSLDVFSQEDLDSISHDKKFRGFDFQESNESYERAEWERLRTCDPKTGLLPIDYHQRELQFLASINGSNQSFVKNPASKIQSVGMKFKSVGPSNVGGRTRAFAIDYGHSNIMLAAGVTGGLWRSVDAGQTWARSPDISDMLNVSCIAQHPSDPDVWYAGTGEVLSTTERRSSTALRTICTGSGIYKSTDHGLRWSRISPKPTEQPNRLVSNFQGVWKLVPGNQLGTNELYAACYGGVFVYSNGVFEKVAGDSVKRSFCTDVARAKDGSVMYAAYGASDSGAAPSTFGIWRSNSLDKVWRNVSPPDFPTRARRIVIAMAPSNTKVLYVFAQVPEPQSDRYNSFGSSLYLWRHTEDGTEKGIWERRKQWLDSTDFNTLAGYAMSLVVHPTNDSIVFIAGTDLYRTTSGFAQTKDAFHLGGYPYIVSPGKLHPDIHSLSFSAIEPYYLYAIGDGGLAYNQLPLSLNEPYWKTLNNGYNVTQCYAASQDHFDIKDSTLTASLQDNSNFVTRYPSREIGWTFCGGGDGTSCQMMPGAEFFFAASQYASMYGFTLSKDNILEYSTFGPPLAYDSVRKAFVSVFSLVRRRSGNDTMLVLPMGNRLFYFKDLSIASAKLSPTREQWREFSSVGKSVTGSSFITTMSVSKSEDGIIYLGCTDGSLYKVNILSDNAVTTKLPSLPVKGFVSSIDCDENAQIIVTLSNYNTPSVFFAEENSYQWRDVSDELEMSTTSTGWGPSVRCARFFVDNVSQREYILAGTSVGLFSREITNGIFSPWKSDAEGTIGSVIVESIDVREEDDRIIIGTHGAGVFESVRSDDTSIIDTNEVSFFQLEQNFPNPVSVGTFIRYNLSTKAHAKLEVFDALGKRMAILFDEVQSAGPHKIELDKHFLYSLASGIYYYKLSSADRSETKAFSMSK